MVAIKMSVLRLTLLGIGLVGWVFLLPDDPRRFGAFAAPNGGNLAVLIIGYVATLVGVVTGAGYREVVALQRAGRPRIVSFRELGERIIRSFDLWTGLFGSPILYALILKAIDGINTAGLLTIALENGFFCTIVINQIIQKQSATTIGSVSGTATFGGTATLTATLTSSVTSQGIACQTVDFTLGGTSVGSAVTNSSGVATLRNVINGSSTSAPGTYTGVVVASYAGSNNHLATANATGDLVVSQSSTMTTLASGINPSVFGQSVTFTATIAAASPGSGTPTGTVNFLDGTKTIGTKTLTAAGVATFSDSSLTAGAHSITAVYSGDTNFTTSTSTALTQTVNQAPAITSAATTTFTSGTAGTFTVTTTGYPIPALTETVTLPTGVTFVDNGNGTATLASTAATAAGTYPLTINATNGVTPDAAQSFTLTVR